MSNRYKTSIPFYTYKQLIEDACEYGFFKKNDDSINKNKFLSDLICNFYQYRKIKRANNLKNLKKIFVKNKENIKFLNSYLDELEASLNYEMNDLNKKISLDIYSTKENEEFLKQMIEDETNEKVTTSSFLRNIFISYCRLEGVEREKILYLNTFNKIDKAIKEHKIISFKSGKTLNEIYPYIIIPNINHDHLYLLGINLNAFGETLVSFQLSKINNVILLNKKYSLSKNKKLELDNALIYGVEFSSADYKTIKIKLTKSGLKMFTKILHNRPYHEFLNEDIILIHSTLSHFYNYFIRFGAELTILDNPELESNFAIFYQKASHKFPTIDNRFKK